MSELNEILLWHAGQYPAMQPQDVVKLIYQNEFGCEHLIGDQAGMLEYLKREIAENAQRKVERRWDEIGSGLVRLHLAGLKEQDAEAIFDAMRQTAAQHSGSEDSFQSKLKEMRRLCQEEKLPFDEQTLDVWLAGYPGGPVHHSDLFRHQYHPAYRVVLRSLAAAMSDQNS